ncbi:hypothetical protein QQP08_008556 [Theobroma cacao]|nr:hypothetical protein QQP08_008556 [Theobroma cacao]
MGSSFEDSDYQPYKEIDRGNVMVTLGDFMKLKPLSFSGVKSIEDPQVFLDEIDKICTALGCSSHWAVELTSFRLTKAPGMTMSDYDIQFTQLSRYAPYMVQTERERIKRGKNVDIAGQPGRRDGNLLRGSTFSSPPNQRRNFQFRSPPHSRPCNQMKAFYYECGGIGHVKRDCPTYRHNQEMARNSIRPDFAIAPTKNVRRDKGKGVASYSQGRSTGPTQQGAFRGGQARVFALTPQDAHVSNAVVTGNLFICGYEASVLFYLGSTHSFVSSNFMPKLGKHYEYMDEPLVVITPLEESYVVEYKFHSCEVQIKDRDTWVDLVLMIILGFDVILGMDWLASCYANVDCYRKLVKFKFSGKPSFVIYGHSSHLVDSVMATITREVQSEERNLAATPVVNEFEDVFPEELPGLPPKKKIEFCIDLIPETQPISMPPYRMASAELKELREQLIEEGCRGICFEMFGVPPSEGRASKTFRIVTTVTGTRIEMGTYSHGLRYKLAPSQRRIRFHMVTIVSDRGPQFTSRFWRRHRPLEFEVGDHVFLKVSPCKGVRRFGKKGKLSSRYIGLFEILERVRAVAYRLALPPNFEGVNLVFHVSMLRKYVQDPSHVIQHDTILLKDGLKYQEQPIAIVDYQVKKLRSKDIAVVKIVWQNHLVEKATWEP